MLTRLALLPHQNRADEAGGSLGNGYARLGEMAPLPRAIDDSKAVIDTVNLQREAVLDLGREIAAGRKSQTDLESAVQRMQAELQGKVKAARTGEAFEWRPGGDDATVEARYVADGKPVLGKRTVRVPTVNHRGEIEEVEQVRPGFLTDPYPVTVAQQRAQDAYTAYAVIRNLGSADRKGGERWARLLGNAWTGFVRAMCEVPGTIGAWSRATLLDAVALRAALSPTAGSGGELIASPTLGTVVRPADIARRIAAEIQVIDAPSSTFKKPAVSGRVLWRKRQAIAADPSRYTVSSVTTTDTTLTLVKFFAQVLVDDTFPTDAGLILGDAVAYIRGLIAEGKADTLEMMMLHGDTAGSHQDTIANWTMGSRYTAGDLAGSESPLTAWLGFRARAFDASATVAGGGAFTATTHFSAINAMGANGAGARMAVGLKGFYTQLLANSLFTTYDKAGAAATLLTGALGQVGDTPVILTDFLAGEYASTGLYTGSGTTNTFVYYNPAKFVLYRNAANMKEWEAGYSERGALYIGAMDEMLLDCWVASGETAAATIINL